MTTARPLAEVTPSPLCWSLSSARSPHTQTCLEAITMEVSGHLTFVGEKLRVYIDDDITEYVEVSDTDVLDCHREEPADSERVTLQVRDGADIRQGTLNPGELVAQAVVAPRRERGGRPPPIIRTANWACLVTVTLCPPIVTRTICTDPPFPPGIPGHPAPSRGGACPPVSRAPEPFC